MSKSSSVHIIEPGDNLKSSQNSADLSTNFSIQAVIEQPELLEKIVNYAIRDEDKQQRNKSLCSIRLVRKCWLSTVSLVMRENKEPLHKLELTQYTLIGSPFKEAQGKLLDQFVTCVENRLDDRFPTLSLKIDQKFFHRENYESFVHFLLKCGQGLVNLNITIPENGGSLPGLLPGVKLHFLQKLEVQFHALDVTSRGSRTAFGHSTNTVCMIQFLVQEANSLKKLSLICYTSDTFHLPLGIEFVKLPASITELRLNCRMRSSDLHLLLKNTLPNLTLLFLTICNDALETGLLSKIVDQFRETLKTLIFVILGFRGGSQRHTNLVRFPKMSKVEKLSMVTTYVELDEWHPLLNECFPNVKQLRLRRQTPEMLRKWTGNSVLKSVEELGIELVDGNKSEEVKGFYLPITKRDMQGVYWAFPNVTRLEITLSAVDASGLQYLFLEMRQLVELTIADYGNESNWDPETNSDYWDSLLIGVPMGEVQALRKNPDNENGLEVTENLASIRNLSALTILRMHCSGSEVYQPLISDLTFTYALFQMQNLQSLEFTGRFMASEAMANEWKRRGRSIDRIG